MNTELFSPWNLLVIGVIAIGTHWLLMRNGAAKESDT